MIESRETSELYVEKILKDISSNFSVDTGEGSLIKNMLSNIGKYQDQYIDELNNIISQMSVNKKNETAVEDFFNFFGVYRLKGSDGYFEMVIRNHSNKILKMDKGTKIKYQNKVYSLTNETYFEYGFRPTDTTILLVESENIGTSIVNINNKIDIEINKDWDINTIKNDLEFINFTTISSNDKNKIMAIPGVKEIKFKKTDNFLEILIFPTKIENNQNLFVQIESIVDFFQTERIVIKKPFLAKIEIRGLFSQLPLIYDKKILSEGIESYFEDLYLSDSNVFNRDNFENYVYNKISENIDTFILDEDKINIKYNIYDKDDHEELLYTDTIYKNSKKNFEDMYIVLEFVE